MHLQHCKHRPVMLSSPSDYAVAKRPAKAPASECLQPYRESASQQRVSANRAVAQRRVELSSAHSAVMQLPSVYATYSRTQRQPPQVYVPITGPGLRTLADKLCATPIEAPVTLDLERASRSDVRSLLPYLPDGPDGMPRVTHSNVALIDLSPKLFASPNVCLRGHQHLSALRFVFQAPLNSDQLHNLLGSLPATLTHLELRGVCDTARREGRTLSDLLQAGPNGFPQRLQVLSLPNNNLDCHDYLALVQRLPASLQQLHFGANNPLLNQAALDCSTQPLPQVEKSFRPNLTW
jgi:hypothetical protein